MKKSLLALACALAALAPVAVAHAQAVTALSSSSITVLNLDETGTAASDGNENAAVSLGGGPYYFSLQAGSPSFATLFLGDLDTAGAVTAAIYEVNAGVLSQTAITTLNNGTYGGAPDTTTFNLSPGTEYALVVTGPSVTDPSAPVASFVANISAAPEPASWALMVFGVGAVGVAMRRSRRSIRGALVAA